MRLNPTIDELTLAAQEHYEPLFRFALRLSANRADASDLTQETFFLVQTRGHQLRDRAKLKTWMGTTLRRLFLQRRRHETRFPKHELSSVDHELPRCEGDHASRLDAGAAREALHALDEAFRGPLVMFYFEGRTYRQIAQRLRIPIGTVMSRLSRGKRLLRARLTAPGDAANN